MLLALCAAVAASSFQQLLAAGRFEELVEALGAGRLDVSAEDKAAFLRSKKELTRQLDELGRQVASLQAQQRISPAFKWGQNRTDVFVQVKLSHRFEAPGCLEVSSIAAEVVEGRLQLRAECVQASSPLLFTLDFALFAAARAHPLERESVGTYLLRLTKAEEALWPDIFAEWAARSAHKSHVWHELESEYPEDMAAALQLMEEHLERRGEL